MLRIFFISILLGVTSVCCAFANANSRSPIIMITGDIINQTSQRWFLDYDFKIYQGYPALIYTNFNQYQAPAKGRFIVSLPIGETTFASVIIFSASHYGEHICDFQISAVDLSHATITQTYAANNLNAICYYSGDPNNNTATITLINNPTYHKK